MSTKKRILDTLPEDVRLKRQDEVYRLHCRGLTIRGIGAELGLDTTQVQRSLTQAKSAIRAAKGKSHLANLADRLTEGAFDDLADSWQATALASSPRQRKLLSIGVPAGLRYQVMSRDGFACRYCGRGAPDVQLEVDHVKPVSAGGSDHADNLMTACSDCNNGKGGESGEEGADQVAELPPDFRALAAERSNRAKLRDQIAKFNGLDPLKTAELELKRRQADALDRGAKAAEGLLQQWAAWDCGAPEDPDA